MIKPPNAVVGEDAMVGALSLVTLCLSSLTYYPILDWQ